MTAAICSSAEVPVYTLVTSGSIPTSRYGTISRYKVTSKCLNGDIIVDIWAPTGYDESGATRYPVVYHHDGQNLYDAKFCFANVPWAVDKACYQLASNEDFALPIIVGINNRGSEGLRANDYFPEKALNYISESDRSKTYVYETCSNNFLGDEEAAFVVTELKPLVDELYNTDPSRPHTFAMGSSMGGLASLYLLCEYPDVFGGAACLSTHWIGSLNLNADYTMNDDEVCAQAILEYMRTTLPSSETHRLYLDQGTKDWDAGYLKYESIAREIAREKGYTEEKGNLYTYDAQGAGHNEWYWQQRAKYPLQFLLSRKAMDAAGIESISSQYPVMNSEYIYDMMGKAYPIARKAYLQTGIYIIGGKKVVSPGR